MPKYRVDLFLADDAYGVVAHIGSTIVEAPNKAKAKDKGYDCLWDERLRGQAGISLIAHRIPKQSEV